MPKVTDDAARLAQREADRQKTRDAVAALKTTAGWKRWLGARRHFHRYSLANQLLIALQKPEATMVAGFRAWLQLGYCVRRGERALRIWVPMPPSRRDIAAWRAAGGEPSEKPRTRFRLGPVFDRSQVAPLPAPAQPAPLEPPISPLQGNELAWAWTPLVALAGELGSEVIVERMPARQGGYFEPLTKRIALNEANSANHRVKTLVHELSHALLRAERADTDLPFGYCEEELVVESIAYTVCGSIGLDTTNYSIPYLAAWSEHADPATIELAAKTIDRIAKRIEERVMPLMASE